VAPELPTEVKKPAAKPMQEAKKTETAQPKSDPAFASKGYYLQLGAFSSEANAKALQAKVQAAGFSVGMADSNGQYRVRVGPIPERDKAMDILAKLRSKGFSPVIIGP
jgi:cell division protein FtsN